MVQQFEATPEHFDDAPPANTPAVILQRLENELWSFMGKQAQLFLYLRKLPTEHAQLCAVCSLLPTFCSPPRCKTKRVTLGRRGLFPHEERSMKNDFELQRDVQDELHWNPRVSAAAIGVAVTDGIVTLTGQVPQFAARKVAVRSAQQVAGVKGVVDHLEVRLASAGERTDADIAQAALNVLAWNSFVPAQAIRVAVHDGWITLAGEVEWRYQRIAAEDAVHALWGVRGVTNTITVRSLGEADIVNDMLKAALRRRAQLQGKQITVEVHGQKVILSGHVDSLDEWEEADAIAWETPGVFAVDNRIVVAFWGGTS
jgi:osmotically-inducible protein OsmY